MASCSNRWGTVLDIAERKQGNSDGSLYSSHPNRRGSLASVAIRAVLRSTINGLNRPNASCPQGFCTFHIRCSTPTVSLVSCNRGIKEQGDENEYIPADSRSGVACHSRRSCRTAYDAAVGAGRQTGRSACTHEPVAEFSGDGRARQSALYRQRHML